MIALKVLSAWHMATPLSPPSLFYVQCAALLFTPPGALPRTINTQKCTHPPGQLAERFCLSAILPTGGDPSPFCSETSLSLDWIFPYLQFYLFTVRRPPVLLSPAVKLMLSQIWSGRCPWRWPLRGSRSNFLQWIRMFSSKWPLRLSTSLLSSSSMCSSCNGFLSLLGKYFPFFHHGFSTSFPSMCDIFPPPVSLSLNPLWSRGASSVVNTTLGA